MRERRVDEVLVRGHSQHIRRAVRGIDPEDAIECRDVQTRSRNLGARPEQVGGLLCQPHRAAGRNRRILPLQPLDKLLVSRVGACLNHVRQLRAFHALTMR